MIKKIQSLLGAEADDLLNHKCTGIPKESLHLPGPGLHGSGVDDERPQPGVLRSLASLYGHGRLANTGYLSILPVDQGMEHSAAASFAPNPIYFDPENIVKLAIEGGCNAVASTLGVLGSVARKYAHKIPFIVKINHNEMLTYPNIYDQTLFASVDQAFDMGAVAVGATIYYGSGIAARQIQEVSEAFEQAHELGMATILWATCAIRPSRPGGGDFHASADLTGQANHLGVTIEADIVKQKMADEQRRLQRDQVRQDQRPGLQRADHATTPSTCAATRWPTATWDGRLINSGGGSGKDDLAEAVRTAVINKRAGGMGLISGRKAFQRPMKDGVELFHAIQDTFLCKEVTIA